MTVIEIIGNSLTKLTHCKVKIPVKALQEGQKDRIEEGWIVGFCNEDLGVIVSPQPPSRTARTTVIVYPENKVKEVFNWTVLEYDNSNN